MPYRYGIAQWQPYSTPLSLITLCEGFPPYIVETAVLTNILLHKYDIHLRYFAWKRRKLNIKIIRNSFYVTRYQTFSFGESKEKRSKYFLRQHTEYFVVHKNNSTVLHSSHVIPESASYLLLVTQEYEF